jgi:hypothetical protein
VPEAISYGDAAGILSEYIGRNISYVSIAEDDARKAIIEMGMSDWHTIYYWNYLSFLEKDTYPVYHMKLKK